MLIFGLIMQSFACPGMTSFSNADVLWLAKSIGHFQTHGLTNGSPVLALPTAKTIADISNETMGS